MLSVEPETEMHQARRGPARHYHVVKCLEADGRGRTVGAYDARRERGAFTDLVASVAQGGSARQVAASTLAR